MAQGRATWAKLIARHGLGAKIIRLGSPDIEVTVTVMRRYAEEDKLEHEVSQQDAWFIVEHTKLQAVSFPTPVRKNDRVLFEGKYFTVFLVEPKYSHGELVGYNLRCTG